jgi:HEAT repeat protein
MTFPVSANPKTYRKTNSACTLTTRHLTTRHEVGISSLLVAAQAWYFNKGEEAFAKGQTMRIAAIVLLVGWVLWVCPAPAQKTGKPDPKKKDSISEIGGKTLEMWIAEIAAEDPSKKENAIRTVLLFGPTRALKALPAIIKELRSHSFAVPLDVSVRTNACIAVGAILGQNLKDADSKQITDAVALLKRLMHDSQDIVKYRTAQALGQIGPEAKSALSELLQALRDPNNWETRQASAMALGRVARDKKGPHPEVVTALSTRLKNEKSAQVRLAVLQAMTTLGPPADKMLRQKLEQNIDHVASKDVDPTVRIWAHMAHMMVTGKIEPKRLEFIGKQVVDGRELPVKIQAAQALTWAGKEAKTQAPHLIAGLDDADKNVVAFCVIALASIGKDAETAVPRLQDLAKSKESPELLQHMATEAIDTILGKNKDKGEKDKKGKAAAGAR